MSEREHPWRIWLMFITGIAVFIVAVIVFRANGQRSEATRRLRVLVSDLERLAEAEDEALARDGHYAAHFATVAGNDTAAFTPSTDVRIRLDRTGESWGAVASDTLHLRGPTRCGIYQGEATASPHRAVAKAGAVACW